MTIRKSLPIGILGLSLIAAGANAQESIKIGLIQPLTGSVAYNGTTDVNGGILLADSINGFSGVVDVKQTIQVVKVGLNFHIWGAGW